jgi:hypothetical protein
LCHQFIAGQCIRPPPAPRSFGTGCAERKFKLVDATYRSDFKKLNELNFARFEAKLGELRAELKSEIEKGLKEQTRYMFLAWASLMAAIIWKG